MAFFSSLFLFYAVFVLPSSSASGSFTLFIRPNFTASYLQFVDQAGAFLFSSNGTFKASIFTLQPPQYYFSLIHTPSDTIIWTANVNKPMSRSANVLLTGNGLVIADEYDRFVWSTPKLDSRVSLMELRESGNLVLLDERNVSLWESFRYPRDTLLVGQRLLVGQSLEAFVAADDLSVGDYRLVVTDGDAVLQWKEMTYWKLSMETRAFKEANVPASFLAMNESGLYLFGSNGSTVVMQVSSGGSGFRVAKLGSDGKFSINSLEGYKSWIEELRFPYENCRLPLNCGKIGLCSNAVCFCPPAFRKNTDGCEPRDAAFSLPSACNVSRNSSKINPKTSYLKIGDSLDYFAKESAEHGVSLSYCQDLCSKNCSCFGVFHENSSGSCYPIRNYLGSVIAVSTQEGSGRFFSGYIKVETLLSSKKPSGKNRGSNLPLAALVLISLSGFFLLLIILAGFVWWRRSKRPRKGVLKLRSRKRNPYSSDMDIISIPGLPVRLEYEELVAATDNFKTRIGSGGFGTVYKGTLNNKSVVAVKKITSLGVQGKKEFCTEIAIIGNIHHVNLVKLKGFCVDGRQRFLVYEYMNRGSLDRELFGDGPVLEWKERLEIALGTARGLAYLHTGCEHKIIHCDVKPENILLHDNLQVKISDFGLSKLLSPEQSSMFTTLRGTRGYLAPEWLTSSGISHKSDVYSYGMVLLEIVRGRRNWLLESQTNGLTDSVGGRIYFPLLALEMHEQRRYLELADPRLEGKVTSEEIEKLVRVALCCLHGEPTLRPTMSNVVGMLKGTMPVGEPKVERFSFLRFYGRRLTETSMTEGFSEPYEFILNDQDRTNNVVCNSLSFLSSQQVSGPR